MSDRFDRRSPASVLGGSMRDYRVPGGADLLARGDGFFAWQDARRAEGLWPFSRSTESGPGTVCRTRDDRGNLACGVNFASQDYLSLAAHPAVKEAAVEAIRTFGAHSAGSSALVGNTSLSVALERRIADFMGVEQAILYPTGWAAGYGVIRGLVRSADHVVMDMLAHTCLQEGANAATKNIYQFRHLDTAGCRRWLSGIRAKDKDNAILVVTEGLFSMDSDTPDIAAMQGMCDEFGATLLVDVAHDLGCLGPGGRGHIGLQGMVGKVDLVMGSFSKTFASNGGFVACRSRALKEYLRFFSPSTTFSNALSPMQAAVILQAFEIVDSAEGDALRGRLMANVLHLRRRLGEAGLETYGDPSAIVAVKMGDEGLARVVSRNIARSGLTANLVEYPAVAKGAARFRMQAMAGHAAGDVEEAVDLLCAAKDAAAAELKPAKAVARAAA